MEKVDCVVVGAGVIGLATARALSRAGREVVIVEQDDRIGSGISARNSEVIHAGIYYTPGLAKARFCVAGKEMLYRFCADYGVAHRRCGKLLVAAGESEIARLAALKTQAQANGVHDLVWLDEDEARALEPELRAKKALLSPSTGIIDGHAFMLALLGDAQAHGAALSLRTPVVGGAPDGDGLVVETGGEAPMRLKARLTVNAGGLGARALALSLRGFDPGKAAPLHLAKGNYFTLARRAPFSRLIYPMPSDGGLGVHLTLDIGGQARFGPDVEWIDEIDYTVDPGRADSFYGAIRKYWPDLRDRDLLPAYAGIRPKIERPGGSTTDFMIQPPEQHGIPGLINLFGIESPGLTSSLAIADHIAKLAAGLG